MTVFFGGPDPKTGEIKLGGTGFLVVHKEDGYGFGYLVTARHVAKKVRPHGDVIGAPPPPKPRGGRSALAG